MARYENLPTKAILDYLRLRGVFCWRQNNIAIYDPVKKIFRKMTSIKGIPDILGILPSGRFIGVEVKSEKGVLSSDQKEFQKNIAEHNGIYIVARNAADVCEILEGELKK